MNLGKIAFVGDYVPRRCGIATFTHDLSRAVAEHRRGADCIVLGVTDSGQRYDYPPEVKFEIEEGNPDSYRRAADFLNFAKVDVVSVQHEFGIYGGPSGSHLLQLLRELRMPVVTTLHTILREPTAEQRRVMNDLTALSARVVVMSERGKRFLHQIYGVAETWVDVIPHGIPDMPFVDPNFFKDQFGVEGKQVLLTFGLLSPNKGVEYVLRALPHIVNKFPQVVYIVLGATHPKLVREQGEAYRLSLKREAQRLGVEKNVIFDDRFVDLDLLKQYLGSADIYVTPYLHAEQITSGTLCFALGCGKAIVSTPYWHAEDLLAEGRGALVPFGEPGAIAASVEELLTNEARRHAMRKKAYMLGREMVWSNVAQKYEESFLQARSQGISVRPRLVRKANQQRQQLPSLKLDHLMTLTDDVGVLQHARYTVPRYEEGYCTDDNARGLILAAVLEEAGRHSAAVGKLSKVTASFLNYAFDSKTKRFRNFMSYDRRWLEAIGSEDSQGRALWALGTCVGRSSQRGLQSWAAELFQEALPGILTATYPRAWAFALLGIHEYFRRLSGDRDIGAVREELTRRLLASFDAHARDDWPWFEDQLTYNNATLAQALILSGRFGETPRAFEVGVQSLRWLTQIQRSERGNFDPIGCDGFYARGGVRARYDQQPIEARATLAACLEAHRLTDDSHWLDEARSAFGWFLGKNDVGAELYDESTGGCRDGLHMDRANQNQGAESCLSFLLSLAELQQLEAAQPLVRPLDVEQDPSSGLLQVG